MSTELGPMYHWSPRTRLDSIKRLGLMPGRRNYHDYYAEYTNTVTGKKEVFRSEYVAFSPSPATAWDYSHGAWKSDGTFDLWQVSLIPDDEVHINPLWGSEIIEVRVHNRIKKSRLTWIGERVVGPPNRGVAIAIL